MTSTNVRLARELWDLANSGELRNAIRDAAAYPLLRQLVAQYEPEAWEQDEGAATLRVLRQAVARIPADVCLGDTAQPAGQAQALLLNLDDVNEDHVEGRRYAARRAQLREMSDYIGADRTFTTKIGKTRVVLADALLKWSKEPASDSTSDSVTNDDPRTFQPDDSYPLFIWAGEHCLDHTLRRVVLRDADSDQRVLGFFNLQSWRRTVRQQEWDGQIYYLTHFRYEDQDYSKVVHLGMTPTQYRQAITTQQMFHEEATAARHAEMIFTTEGAPAFVKCSPPTNLFVNITIIDRDDCLFALKRSTTTHDTGNVWTLGPCETMRDEADEDGNLPEPQAMQLDTLVRKGLYKEAALDPDDYGPISISWLGYDFWMPTGDFGMANENYPGGNVRFHAQVRSRLSTYDIWDRIIRVAPDRAEHADRAPIPFTEASIRSIIRAAASSTRDEQERLWVRFSALAAAEVFRCASLV